MPGESPTPSRSQFLRAAAGLALAGLCFAIGASLRGDGTRVSAVPVAHVETVLPACGEPVTGTRRLTVVTAYLPREDADALSRIVVTGAGTRGTWSRAGGVCTDGEAREPCPTEACREGICAVRWPLPEVPGPIDVELHAGDGRRLGGGRAMPPDGALPEMPNLSARRLGREVRLAGDAGLVARVSAMRAGRVSADVPTFLGPDGAGRFSVPEGADAVRVSVSRGGEEGVAQASVLLPAPFAGACPP